MFLELVWSIGAAILLKVDETPVEVGKSYENQDVPYMLRFWPGPHSFDRFFDRFVPTIELSATLFHLGLDGRLEALTEESDQVGLFWRSRNIKLRENGLELL